MSKICPIDPSVIWSCGGSWGRPSPHNVRYRPDEHNGTKQFRSTMGSCGNESMSNLPHRERGHGFTNPPQRIRGWCHHLRLRMEVRWPFYLQVGHFILKWIHRGRAVLLKTKVSWWAMQWFHRLNIIMCIGPLHASVLSEYYPKCVI